MSEQDIIELCIALAPEPPDVGQRTYTQKQLGVAIRLACGESTSTPFDIEDFPEWVESFDGYDDSRVGWQNGHGLRINTSRDGWRVTRLSRDGMSKEQILFDGPLTKQLFTALCEALNIKKT